MSVQTDRTDALNVAIRTLRSGSTGAMLCTMHDGVAPDTPREFWIETANIWIRADGSRVSGWFKAPLRHNSWKPGWIDRWRIRRAVRAWERAQ